MPYKSIAQAAYFHTHRKELEKQGVDVGEWDRASKGMNLPDRIGPEKKHPLEKLKAKRKR